MHVYAVVEGSCEERFLKSVVSEHFAQQQIWLTPQRVKRGGGARGGGSSWQPWRTHIRNLLAQNKRRNDVCVTTMFDLYRAPRDTPGFTEPGSVDGPQRADAMIVAIEAEFSEHRCLLPYVQVYEFETLLFADLDEFALQAPDYVDKAALGQLKTETATRSPEEVNDGDQTAPSKRLAACAPGFRKTAQGLQTAQRIGLPRLRAACPRFDAWLRALEHRAQTWRS